MPENVLERNVVACNSAKERSKMAVFADQTSQGFIKKVHNSITSLRDGTIKAFLINEWRVTFLIRDILHNSLTGTTIVGIPFSAQTGFVQPKIIWI